MFCYFSIYYNSSKVKILQSNSAQAFVLSYKDAIYDIIYYVFVIHMHTHINTKN